MNISKRLLTKWRREALKEDAELKDWDCTSETTILRREMANRILLLTQELIDQYLLNESD